MDLVQISVLGLTYHMTEAGNRSTNDYVLVMGEVGGHRRIPIVVGQSEARAIVLKLRDVKSPRPLTHDLFRPLTEYYGVRLRRVYIHKVEDGVFYADMMYMDAYDNNLHLDARVSDAIAIALRTTAPIFIERSILDQFGVVEQASEETGNDVSVPEGDSVAEAPEEKTPDEKLFALDDSELRKSMADAIEREDYERAAVIKRILSDRGT